MNDTLRPELLGDIFAVPAAVVDEHIRLAGSAQLKVLLWALRAGKGSFDVERCAAAIGLSAPDCADAMQYWFQTGVLIPRERLRPFLPRRRNRRRRRRKKTFPGRRPPPPGSRKRPPIPPPGPGRLSRR